MTQYRRITEKIAGKLKPKQAYLFYCLALKSDFNTDLSHIKQDTLTDFYGIKKTDQIGKWLKLFEKLGLVEIDKTDEKGRFGKFNRCHYRLNTEHFVLITDKLHSENISNELKGFLILLKCKCLNGTNTTLYSQNQLAEELDISTGSISKYMKLAIDNGYIKKDKKGTHLLREDIFKITKETEIGIMKCVYPNIITDEDISRGYIK